MERYLGVMVAILLLLLLPACAVASVFFLFGSIAAEIEMNQPERTYEHEVRFETANITVTITYPSKIEPGTPVSNQVWATYFKPIAATTVISGTEILILSRVEPPLFISNTDSLVLTLGEDGKTHPQLSRFDYRTVDAVKNDHTATGNIRIAGIVDVFRARVQTSLIEYRINVEGDPKVVSVTFEVPIDNDASRNAIVVARNRAILGIMASIVIPLLAIVASLINKEN